MKSIVNTKEKNEAIIKWDDEDKNDTRENILKSRFNSKNMKAGN